jgi:hypothetical protein
MGCFGGFQPALHKTEGLDVFGTIQTFLIRGFEYPEGLPAGVGARSTGHGGRLELLALLCTRRSGGVGSVATILLSDYSEGH